MLETRIIGESNEPELLVKANAQVQKSFAAAIAAQNQLRLNQLRLRDASSRGLLASLGNLANAQSIVTITASIDSRFLK
jgi:hypothetical protein